MNNTYNMVINQIKSLKIHSTIFNTFYVRDPIFKEAEYVDTCIHSPWTLAFPAA